MDICSRGIDSGLTGKKRPLLGCEGDGKDWISGGNSAGTVKRSGLGLSYSSLTMCVLGRSS